METIAKTISIHLICDLAREAAGADLEFYPPRVKNGIITIMQKDFNARFTDAYFVPDFCDFDDVVDDVRTFGLNLTANMECNNDDLDCYIEIDSLGQLQIIPESVENKFIDVSVETDSMLVTEDAETPTKEQRELGQEEDGESSQSSDEASEEKISAEVILDEDQEDTATQEPLTEDAVEDDEIEWIVTYDLPISESLVEASDELPSNKRIISAPNLETAVKYADQQARILARENSEWKEAEVVGIQKR